VSYPAQVKLAGAQEVFAPCDASTDFKLSPDALAEYLEGDSSITGLVLCSPSNPTGEVYSEDELRALAQVLTLHPHVRVIFDAMYDRLYYDGDIAPDLLAVAPELGERVVTVNGFSKTYAMTGWRLGFTIASEEIAKAMNKFQSQSTSNPTSFAQYGALSALELDDSVINKMKDTFKRRREIIVSHLNAIDGVECRLPKGAFYAFPDFNAYIGPDKAFQDDLALATALLDDAKVAVVPGSAFGAPGHMRLSYATSDALIAEGVQRIHNYLKSL
jgi:aspartate aminotransferase